MKLTPQQLFGLADGISLNEMGLEAEDAIAGLIEEINERDACLARMAKEINRLTVQPDTEGLSSRLQAAIKGIK